MWLKGSISEEKSEKEQRPELQSGWTPQTGEDGFGWKTDKMWM